MMYDLQHRRPDLIVCSDDNNLVLRSNSKTIFKYEKLCSDIYMSGVPISEGIYSGSNYLLTCKKSQQNWSLNVC